MLQRPPEEPISYQAGDKVRIRRGPHAGVRGVICAVEAAGLRVQLSDGTIVQFPTEEVTNYSLAARRAWQTMPKRSGRPRSPGPGKKMISMRVDVDVWRRLGQAAELGLIPSREEAVNTWLREKMDALWPETYSTDPTPSAHETHEEQP